MFFLGQILSLFQPKKVDQFCFIFANIFPLIFRLQELQKRRKKAWSVGVISMLLHKTCEFKFSLVQPCTRQGKLSHHQTRNCEQLCFEILKFLNREITFLFGQCVYHLIIYAHKEGHFKVSSVWSWAMKQVNLIEPQVLGGKHS